MDKEEFLQEGIDGKRFVLCMRHSIWFALLAALAGALLAGGIYLLVRRVTMGEPQYRAEVLYAIRYDIQEEDEVLKEFINEYNAYTWGDMMRSDRVMHAVCEALPDVERSVIEASISTGIASDPEFLTAYFTTADETLSNRIAVACSAAMEAFGKTMQGRGLYAIEVWKTVPAAEVAAKNRLPYAMELGAIIGLVAGILALAARYVLDDSVMLEGDFERRYPYPVLGYRTKKPDASIEASLCANLERQAQKGAFREIELSAAYGPGADYDALREAPVVLLVEQGTPCLRMLGHVIHTLILQDVRLLGIIITEADGKFLRMYYRKGWGRT